MKTLRIVLAACAALLIIIELWDAFASGDGLNWLLLIAMGLVILSVYLSSRGTDRWRVGSGG